jgi:hypothetical protein
MIYRNHQDVANEIEQEIIHRGALLGIDWTNEEQVAQIAYHAFFHAQDVVSHAASTPDDLHARTRAELYGLAALMLHTMEDAANGDTEIHGGMVWKAFGRALWKIAKDEADTINRSGVTAANTVPLAVPD